MLSELFKSTTYQKENVDEFLKKHDYNRDIKHNDLIKIIPKILTSKLGSRRVTLNIKTTEMTAAFIRKSKVNFNIAFLSIVLNADIDKLSVISQSFKTRKAEHSITKLVLRDVYLVICSFLRANNKLEILDNLGLFFDYYYIVKQ